MGKSPFILFCGLSTGFLTATRPNNLVYLNRHFTVVIDTGLDRDLFTSARICDAVRRLFHFLVTTTMNLSSLEVVALGLSDRERS
jgi:hypothetical protein